MDWKNILGTVAPMLATAVGGPLAGTAVKFLTDGLGLNDGAGEKEISIALKTATPETLAKLKELDNSFVIKMEELGINLEEIHAKDRNSARNMQVETRSRMPAFIALTALAGFFGILTAMIFIAIPPISEAPVNIMLGVLGTLVVGISNFYFGSSKGSADKTQIMATQANNKG